MAFLQLEKLSKYYGDFTAVEQLNLSVGQGEFVSLLGPSGCGKTTTLQMIAGFVEASAGRVLLNGRDITHEPPNRRGLGIVFQSYALFPHMTVSANVRFGLEMRKVSISEANERVQRALSLVQLTAFSQRYPRELSGGQRQRVALARALVIEPPVLLLDEPMSNLDAKLRENMQLELRAIQRKVGTTTIMVTHDQSEALSMSDRVVVMEAGRAIQTAQPLEAYEYPVNAFVSQFVGKANLFEAQVESVDQQGAVLNIAGQSLSIAHPHLQPGQRITLCLRPEKLERCLPAQAMLNGHIGQSVFLGNQWLYHIDTRLGQVQVIWPNGGEAVCSEGTPVSLRWSERAVHILQHEPSYV